MSEVENSTTDIDNNVQETPKQTPKKRLSRAEKARLESEELLKALGVSIEAGRQTRSSRRGTSVVETPKPEPPKRKQPSTPRTSKKAKIIAIDQVDSTNHVEESNNSEAQIAETPKPTATSTTSSAPATTVQDDIEETPIAPEPIKNNGESDQKMDVDSPVEECTQSDERTQPEEVTQPTSVPQPEIIEDSPIAAVDDEPPIEEDSLPVEDTPSSAAVEVTEIIDDDENVSAADTTATIVIDSEPAPPSTTTTSTDGKDEPIELQSSPSDVDLNEDNIVTNSQAVSDTIFELESSNEGDAKNEAANSQEANSLDLEIINSDSSLGETQDEPQSSSTEDVPQQSLPTSTAEVTITEITDAPAIPAAQVVETNDIADNSVHSSEPPQSTVESTNQIPIPDNFRTTITSVEETITTTSESLLTPNATTA